MVRGENMISKQDRVHVRTPTQLEQKYKFDDISKNRNDSSKQNLLIQQVSQDLASFKVKTNAKFDELGEHDKMWFYSGVPTLENYPAADWNTDELKAKHMGDMYCDVDNGNMYIFKCVDETYLWDSCFGDGACDVDHDALYQEGYTSGYEIGLEEGKQSSGGEYSQAFIDNIFGGAVTELRIESTTIAEHGCRGRIQLVKVILPKVTTFQSYAFYNCTKLAAVIIGTNSVPTLKNVNVFTNTLIASGTGYIYVPANLVDSYKTASNWSSYAAQIRAIEDYPDIVQ